VDVHIHDVVGGQLTVFPATSIVSANKLVT
jgi:hypothetical protein